MHLFLTFNDFIYEVMQCIIILACNVENLTRIFHLQFIIYFIGFLNLSRIYTIIYTLVKISKNGCYFYLYD